MMRKIIGKIIDIVLPPKEQAPVSAEEAPTAPIKEVKAVSLEQILGGALGDAPAEPDLRVIGLYSSVEDEKIAELTQALLYLNEMNRLLPEGKEKKPVEFYINTYGGSADDMFAMYDVMQQVMEETEIHTIGVGKVMSAGNFGNLPNLANELEAIQCLQEDYIAAMVENTKFTRKKLEKLLNEKVNIYLDAEEAVRYGLADEIM